MQIGMQGMMGNYFGTGNWTLTLIVIIFGLIFLYINYLMLIELRAVKETMEKVKELLTSIQ